MPVDMQSMYVKGVFSICHLGMRVWVELPVALYWMAMVEEEEEEEAEEENTFM